ncbi:MAG: hypothetical protein M3Y64_08865 [Gemmatimonadota bacterium]|nr:hypothetical protein [Gemmatimonadota bacterium]
MNTASRSSNSDSAQLHAPYAVPKPAADPAERADGIWKLAPFIPRAHRDVAGGAVASVDASLNGERSRATDAELTRPAETAELPWIEAFVQDSSIDSETDSWSSSDSPSRSDSGSSRDGSSDSGNSRDGSSDSGNSSDGNSDVGGNSGDSSNGSDVSNSGDSNDGIAEDSWPMGEAAKRLDELTESLTSIDAGRALLHASEHATVAHSPAAVDVHTVWNDDEWMDIMPTSGSAMLAPEHGGEASASEVVSTEWSDAPELEAATSTELDFSAGPYEHSEASADELAEPDIANIDFSDALSASYAHAETTARALERIAERVRSGDVPVPPIQNELGEAAVLAAVLAALLGWRR